ncbi:hypothetical protein [Burkholderia mayonis]|uniref:hypothetical protein n=1 Tax=Burkholderia mayonis TaxID=1385591 RepID=UPI0009E7157D|nr:hypothetical protein [Burkholderia mayonis]
MALKLTNNAVSTLASALTASATSLAVMPGDGAKYPALGAGDWFPLTVVKSDGSFEIMRCTAIATDTLTVARAQEGTVALAFNAGDRVELRWTARAFQTLWDSAESRVLRSGDTMSGALNVPLVSLNFGLEGDDSAPRIYNDASKRDIVFRTGPSSAYKYSYFDADGTLVLSARPSWGATPWDTGNFDPNGKLTKGEDVAWRLRISAPNWQADMGLRSGSGDDTWTYIRARQGGGCEIINNAYNFVTWAVDDWGNMYSRGAHRMTPGGNWWFENRGWSNDVLNDLYNRSAPRECQFNSGAVEFGPLTAGATLQAPNPYVMIGLRTASSDYMRMGEQFIRCVTIRTY